MSVRVVDGTPHANEVRDLVARYVRELGRDLSFQGIGDELDDLATKYGADHGELLAAVDDSGSVVGCVAWRVIGDGRCEMKRLYVLPEARRTGAGRLLCERAIGGAREAGMREMVLDTIEPLVAAIALYESLGFRRIPPYYDNPMSDVVYLGLPLDG